MRTPELESPILRLWAPIILLGWIGAPVAEAQFPDALSNSECPGCQAAVESAPPGLEGVWATPLTSAGDPAWDIEDFACFAGCTVAAREYARRLLRDPANAQRTILELLPIAVAANAPDAARSNRGDVPPASGPSAFPAPGFACEPHGLATQVLSHLPLQIEQHARHIVLRYEELGATRTVVLDEPPTSAESTPFGISRGRIEDRTLVVETVNLPAGRLHPWFGGGAHSAHLHAIERYVASDDGLWLDLTLELRDPETLLEPLVVTKRWRRASAVRLASHYCDIMSGQLGPVFAEYVDPRTIDARRRTEISVR